MLGCISVSTLRPLIMQVLAVGPRDMRMFYYSWNQKLGRYVVGLATSPDGFKWTKQGMVFDPAAQSGGSSSSMQGLQSDAHDALGAAGCCVVRDVDSRQYLMFYEAVAADGRRSIGLAVSKDGKADWKRCPTPLLTGSGEVGAWDSGRVGAPCAVSMSGGKWRLYYCGRAEDSEGEGFAHCSQRAA